METYFSAIAMGQDMTFPIINDLLEVLQEEKNIQLVANLNL